MALTVIPLSGLANDVVDSISAGAGGGGPRIANVQIANSSWGLLDDTAVSTDGGYVLINGSGFVSGCSVLVANSQATPVTFANSSLLRVEVPAKSASTYAVYVLNPDGGTAIGINALTYSAFPAWATGSTLSSGSADVEISVQLSASDATTYTLQAGSSLPANTTLTSGGLFSGTITGINEETTYTFTVEATDAQNQNTPRTFSITITVGDSYFKSTTLLLNADANTYVRDASDNAFAITVNGDTRPSAFSPYNTNWSNYFDGNSDSLSFATSTALSLSGAFTIEFWIFLESLALDTINPSIITFPTQPNAWQVYVNSAGSYIGIYNGTSDVVNTTSSSITANRWYHVAISRDASSNMAIFLDGVRKGSTASGAGTIGSTTGTIYFMSYGNNTGDVKGYLSNLRIVKGNAVYDPTQTTLTVPTTALTAVSNTQLLICQSNRIIDNSANAFTITRNGDVKVTSFGPFTETDVTTGSGYFDGSGDYLSVPDSVAFDYGTGSLTLEAWIYTAVKVDYQSIIGSFDGGSAGWYIHTNVSGTITFGLSPSVSYTGSRQVCDNAWHHVALVRNGSSDLRLYVDGVLDSTVTSSVNVINPVEVRIGSLSSGFLRYFTGHITDVRVVKGTAVYTSAFTPPTSPLTSVANTQLLTLQNRTGITNHQFVDESGTNSIITKNGNVSQGSFSPYSPAGWSGYFDGTGDYLTVASIGTMTGDFTYECWIFPLSTAALFLPAQIGNEAAGRFYAAINTSRTINLEYYGVGTITLSGATVTANEWNHLAITRSGSTMRGFINGVLAGSTTSITGTIGNAGSTFIGASSAGSAPINGYISNLRIVRGTALYTSNFTPPTSPLTPISNTVLLTLRTGSFVDESANRFAITRNGDVKIELFSPLKSHTITANTYSVYFDGSGDYLQLSESTAFSFGTGNFTIEAFVYLTTTQNFGTIFLSSTSGLGNSLHIQINNANKVRVTNETTEFLLATNAIPLNTWTHIAVTRSGTTLSIWQNGVSNGSTTNNTNFTANGSLIGYEPVGGNFYYTGYISNLRVVKGAAVYTSAFTTPASPLAAIADTSLLTCQSTTIIDNSTNAFTITATGNVIPSKFNPFGETIAQGVEYRANTHGGSAYFDGTDDNLITSSSSNLALGSGDFTIEMWVYPNNTSVAYRGLIASDAYSATTNGWTVYQYGTNIEMYYSSGGGTPNIFTAASVLVAGVWQHVVISRSSGTLKCFVNGVQVASVSNSIAFAGSIIYIGDNNAGNYFYSGYISDVRIVKGTALYKAAFIPPTTTLGAIKETVLLLNNDRGGIMDVSSRNILECVGNARVSTDTKKYGSGAMFFDGTGDNLTIPSSPSLDFGAGDFTVELWANFSALSTNRILLDRWASGNAGGWQLYWRGTGTSITFFVNATVILQDANTTRITTGTWYHIALARSGSTVRLFVDGTSVESNTLTTSLTSTLPMYIGAQGSTSTNYLSGYIDDLRITKGVARYTTTFTAPTSAHQTK